MLVRTDKDGTQRPVYYISRVLHDVETKYTLFENIIFALIISAWHLRSYLQAYSIAVLIDNL